MSRPARGHPFLFLFRTAVLRPLMRDRLRAALTVLGVALGVAVLLAIQLANRASLEGFRAALNATSGRAALEITAPPLGVRETWLAELGWLREFGVASPVIEADLFAETLAGGGEMLRVLGVDGLRDPALRDYPLQTGGGGGAADGLRLLSLLGDTGQILITRDFARSHALAEGDEFTLTFGDRPRQMCVAGILGEGQKDGMPGLRGNIAVLDIATAQSLLERGGYVDRIELRLHGDLSVTDAETKIRARLPPGLTVLPPERRSQAVENMLAAFHFNLRMLSTIALVVGLFLIYDTVSVSVLTRRVEIGMLRTLGVGRLRVLGLFLGEAFLLSVAGALAGVVAGHLLARMAVHLTSATVDVLYVAHAARVPGFSVMDLLWGILVAIPLALVAAARPALEAARVSPVAAVSGGDLAGGEGTVRWRHFWLPLLCLALGAGACMMPPVRGLPLWGYGAAGLAVLGMAFAAPLALRISVALLRGTVGRWLGITGRLAAAQVSASTGRLSVSVAALAVSIALTVAIAVMVASFRRTVTVWVDNSMGADLYLRPATPPLGLKPPAFGAETAALLRAHPLVESVEEHRALDLVYEGRLVKLGTGDSELQSLRGKVALKTSGDARVLLGRALQARAVLVSEAFAMRFGKSEGDTLLLNTADGPHRFTIGAVFYDYSNDRGTILMDQALFAECFGPTNPTHVALYLKPGADAEAVREDLRRALGNARVLVFTNAGLRGEVLRIFDGTFAITWALEWIAIVVAMVGVATTLLTLMIERRGEIRLLRLAGAGMGQVRRTVLIESALIGVASQALGLASGVLLSLVLVGVINPQSFGWSIQFHPPWVLILGCGVLTIGATILAGILPARRAAREACRPPSSVAVWVAALCLIPGPATQAVAAEWEEARPGYAFEFPRDHGQHPDHKIEWWYFTGNVETPDKQHLGYQLVFFRIGTVREPVLPSIWALRDVWMAHLAVTDPDGRRHLQADRLNRAGPGLAGARAGSLDVWNEDWKAGMSDGRTIRLSASERSFGLDLELDTAGRVPVIHGNDGLSRKGATPGNASHYYSLTRLPTSGTIRLGERILPVAGSSWMDHEFGTSFLEKGQQGWDWFSVHLEDGGDLMLFRVRHAEGDGKSILAGTWVGPDGKVVGLDDFRVVPGRVWISPRSGAAYPVEWKIEVPALDLRFECAAALDAQEMAPALTPGLHYWEGAVNIGGTRSGNPVRGRGYLEMTGYSGRSMSEWFGTAPGGKEREK